MNRVSNRNEGYTIFETLIFLAVTGVLFSSTISIVSGQQARTEFTQAVRSVQTQIQDISNDVATGYYNDPGNFKCQAVGSPVRPQLVFSGPSTQGRNDDCIFLGRAVQFAPAPVGVVETINTYNVVGVRKTAAGTESKDYSEANPTAMGPGTSTNPSMPRDAIQTVNLENGLRVGSVQSWHNGVRTDVAGFAYMSSLAQYSLGIINSGSLTLDLVPVGSPAMSEGGFIDVVNSFNAATFKNPNGGFVVCLNSASGNQHAKLVFGTNKKLTPSVEIFSGPCV